MRTTEDLLAGLVTHIKGTPTITVKIGDTQSEINFAGPYKQIDIISELENIFQLKPGMFPDPNSDDSLTALLSLLNNMGLKPNPPLTPGRVIDFMVSQLIEPNCIQPTFLCNHPKSLSPLAKTHHSNNKVTERFELFVATKEICNAYSELNDPLEQRRRFSHQQQAITLGDLEAHISDEDYCRALELGMPPTGGWGMGLDRVCMMLTGQVNIREVLFFPIVKPSLNLKSVNVK